MKNIRKYIIGTLMLIAGISFYSCDDEMPEVVTTVDYDRVFSPTGMVATIFNSVELEIRWDKLSYTDDFVFEVWADSLVYQKRLVQATLPKTQPYYRVTLPGNAIYTFRVKGINEEGKEDSKWNAMTLRLKKEQLFIKEGIVTSEFIGANSVTLNWRRKIHEWDEKETIDLPVEVTHINILQGDNLVQTRQLTPQEIEAGVAVINGLEMETTYKAQIYNGDVLRGTTNEFTTTMLDPISVTATTIRSKDATITWEAGNNITSVQVMKNGSLFKTQDLTQAEQDANTCVVDGLDAQTTYDLFVYSGSTKKGKVTITTKIALNGAIEVSDETELTAALSSATDGTVIALKYKADGYAANNIVISKSISLISHPENTQTPVVKGSIALNTGVQTFLVEDLDFDGTNTASNFMSVSTALQDGAVINVKGCKIYNYTRGLYSHTAADSKIGSLTFDDCVVSNIPGSGGDGIDIRKSFIAKFTIKNSTFNNCFRSFLRIDAGGDVLGTGMKIDIINNTFNNICQLADASNKGFLYVRAAAPNITLSKNLFTNNTCVNARLGNNGAVSLYEGNFFYNNSAIWFTGVNWNLENSTANGGGELQASPYTNAATGDFTLTNASLKNNNIGDPRWNK